MSPTPTSAVPLYLDWQFWTAFVAFAALILSQFPPLYPLLKRGRLTLEANDRINVTHTLGHPNVQVHLLVTNHGGRSVRVRRITLQIRRDTEQLWLLNGGSYFQNVADANAVLLTPFTVRPGDDWAHIVVFGVKLSRREEQRLRQVQSAVRTDIAAKKQQPGNADVLVEADADAVTSAIMYFSEEFNWEAGEYLMTISIETEPAKASLEKRYRMTIFESDSAELRRFTDQYKWGLGVYYFDVKQQPGVFATLTEV